jgi:hypothetical protein
MEYPCHSPDEPRWFVGRVLPLGRQYSASGGIHENMTERNV